MTNFLKALLPLVVLTGCASHLSVTDQAGKQLPGIPVPAMAVFQETGIYTQSFKGGACTPAAFSQTVTEPSGQIIYVNVKPAQLAKTSLDVKLTSNGMLQEVTLNTEPSAGDIIKNTADAIKTIAPLVGMAAAPIVGPATSPPCDAVPDPNSLHKVMIGSATATR